MRFPKKGWITIEPISTDSAGKTLKGTVRKIREFLSLQIAGRRPVSRRASD
jgi:hypothetical protein